MYPWSQTLTYIVSLNFINKSVNIISVSLHRLKYHLTWKPLVSTQLLQTPCRPLTWDVSQAKNVVENINSEKFIATATFITNLAHRFPNFLVVESCKISLWLSKLDRVAPLITDPPRISFNTLLKRRRKLFTWHVYMTSDIWHVTHDTWHGTHRGEVNILSKCEVLSSWGLGVKVLSQRMTQ